MNISHNQYICRNIVVVAFMDFISERVGYTKTSEDLTIFIKASKKSDIKKINYIKIWIILWGLSGVLLVSQFFFPYTIGPARFYLVGLLGFWGYFLYIGIKAYYFRKYGLETIYVNNDKFMIRRDVYSKPGKPKWFKANEKSPFNVVDEKPGGVNAFFYNSFWVITGGTISFGAKKSEFRFGLQLEEEETKKVVSMLNKAIHAKTEKK
jgi:hypothetical protein